MRSLLPMAAVLTALLVLPLVAAGDEVGKPAAEPPVSPRASGEPPSLDLERLLRVPSGRPVPRDDLRGGKGREAWERSFGEARDEVAQLEARIERNKRSLRDSASEDWSFTPAGGGAPSDPEVLRLRAELRRDRQSLETARTRLRDLEVEASLAGVPDAWRVPSAKP